MLTSYLEYFTSKPGKYALFAYEFKVTPFNRAVRSTRPVTVSVRSAVRNQNRQMLNDGVVEMSDLSYLNPLTTVLKDG